MNKGSGDWQTINRTTVGLTEVLNATYVVAIVNAADTKLHLNLTQKIRRDNRGKAEEIIANDPRDLVHGMHHG